MQRKIADLIILDDKAAQYIIRDSLGVLTVLKRLKNSKSLINIHIDAHTSYISPIVDVDRTSFYFDVGPDETINRKLLSSNNIICTTFEDKIKVQFELKSVILSSIDKHKAFKCPNPDMLLRLQRREYYRVEIPRVYNVSCTYRHDNVEHSLTLNTIDISGGGLAVKVNDLPPHIKENEILENCILNLHDLGSFKVACRVCYVFNKEENEFRIGLEFLNIRDADIMRIQKLVMQIERLNKI